MLPESIRTINKQASTKKPRKPSQKPESTAPAVPPAAQPTEPLTEAQRLEALESLSPTDLHLMADVVSTLGGETAQIKEFECVATIARAVLARLLMGSLGAKILDINDGLSEFQNAYLDILDGIESALPHCSADDLKSAALELSFKH